MTARILTTVMMAGVFAGVLPAADSQMVTLLMPDAKVVAGVNVAQAKNTPFGQFVLAQAQTQGADLQQLIAQAGFDPTRDVNELLVASNGVDKNGLLLARGTFNVDAISSFAAQHGAAKETFNGVTILEDPKQENGIAFLNSTLVAAGGVANVKAAISRQTVPTTLAASLIALVNHWSATEDAWVVTNVPPSSLKPGTTVPVVQGPAGNVLNGLQNIQQAAAGVKFGSLIVLTAQAQADNAQDAQQMASALQLIVGLAQMQVNKENPQAASVLSSLAITAQGAALNVSLSVTQDQVQQLIKGNPAGRVRKSEKKM